MIIISDLKPYSYRRKIKWPFALSVWEILYDDTPIRVLQCNRESVDDMVHLLNCAFQEGWMSKAVEGNKEVKEECVPTVSHNG